MIQLWNELGLNSREIATLIWIAIFIAMFNSAIRANLPALLKSIFNPKVILVFLCLAFYTAALTWGMSWLGFWDTSLLKDTFIWYLVAGIATIFQAVSSAQVPNFFRKLFFDAFRFTIVIEFLLEKFTLPLGYELIIVPVITALLAMIAIAESKKEYSPALKLLRAIFTVIAVTLLILALNDLYHNYAEIFSRSALHEFLLAPALTLGSIPFFYVLSLLSSHEQLLMRMGFLTRQHPELTRYAKCQAFLRTNLSHRRLLKLTGGKFAGSILNAKSKEEIRRAIVSAIQRKEPVSLSAEVIETSLIPCVIANTKKPAQKALVTLKNTSDLPLAVVYGDIEAFGEDGEKLQSSCSNCCFFISETADRIPPGETYKQPSNQGFILTSHIWGKAVRVEARVTSAFSELS